MDKASLHRAVLAQIAERLPGWNLFEDDRALERVLGTVTWRVHVSALDHSTGVDVLVDVAVTHHRRGERICCVGGELGALDGEPPSWFRVDEGASMPAGIEQIFRKLETTGLPFLARYTSVPEILRVLRHDPTIAARILAGVSNPAAEAAAIEARWQD